jgi:ABC-type polysaccharide/polyol phosphate transport system ATPase subunit
VTAPVIELDHVSKTYKGYVRESLGKTALNLVRGRVPTRERFLALDDVSFAVAAGQSVALMGLNGSGKTTALSLIARISSPSSGTIRIRGRVGALLAVGTGLHGDLTGRENIEVYGRILGYTPAELRARFDQIVEFAEVSHALDRPLKFYSTGMALRLGFSIAAHIEPEVMLVDEAVSVGDVLFQERCLARMSELVAQGSALILVSHQPEIVARVCRDGILLRQGRLVAAGTMERILGDYLEETDKVGPSGIDDQIAVLDWDTSDFDFATRRIRIDATVRSFAPLDDPRFAVTISDLQHGPLITSAMALDVTHVGDFTGTHRLACELHDVPLRAGVYRVVLTATSAGRGQLLLAPHVLGHLTWGDPAAAPVGVSRGALGPVTVATKWTLDPEL